MTSMAGPKSEGTIADAFASLSGQAFAPLEPRFATIKAALISGHEDAVVASWNRLLTQLGKDTSAITTLGSSSIPSIDFDALSSPPAAFADGYKSRGVAVIRNVLPSSLALGLKADLKGYIATNPHTRAFPPENPQVYELYWSPSQIRARSHPSLLEAQGFLLSYWHAAPNAHFSPQPISYADRLRIRTPGDATFALGPHMDGGGPERWEPSGYGRAGTYNAIWRGEWETYDPWDAGARLEVESDLYAGPGACSVFRAAQGWLSMSTVGPGEGTLKVCPMLQLATSYLLLRPFFKPIRAPGNYLSGQAELDELEDPAFLDAANWTLETPVTAWMHGATPGRGQELSTELHPHLKLDKTMVHVPTVQPGDYVAWHCDTIHAVDQRHDGKQDSSVMYIPAAPLTEANARYLKRQREAFLQGVPPPDFPGGEGEATHVGRPGSADMLRMSDVKGLRAFGLEAWEEEMVSSSPGENLLKRQANQILDFSV